MKGAELIAEKGTVTVTTPSGCSFGIADKEDIIGSFNSITNPFLNGKELRCPPNHHFYVVCSYFIPFLEINPIRPEKIRSLISSRTLLFAPIRGYLLIILEFSLNIYYFKIRYKLTELPSRRK